MNCMEGHDDSIWVIIIVNIKTNEPTVYLINPVESDETNMISTSASYIKFCF